MRGLAVVLAFASACINPDLVPCGDNSCPQGTICLADAGRCVTQAELDACSGIADGTQCTLESTPGVCANGACTLALCGDGILEPGEGCDGAVPAGVGCGYFGYYRGTLACSDTCQLDTSTCAGRCGDGVIDSDQGEYCDGAVPSGASCFDFGYDQGQLACGRSCGADLSTCHSLSWSRVLGSHDSVSDLWGGDDRVGVVFSTGVAWVIHDYTNDTAPGTGYAVIAGSATAVWAAGPTTLARWDASASSWSSVVPPWPAASSPHDIWVSDSLGIYVSISGSPMLWHFDGTSWTQVTGTWTAAPTFGTPEDELYVLYFTDVATFDGTTWGTLDHDGLTSLVRSGDGNLAGFNSIDGEIEELVAGAWQAVGYPTISASVSGPAASPTGLYFGQTVFNPGGAATTFFGVGPSPLTDAWIDGAAQLVSDGTGAVYSGASSGLYALDRGEWDEITGKGRAIAFDGTGAITAAEANYEAYTLDSSDNWDDLGEQCDFAEVIGATTYCASGGTLSMADGSGTTTLYSGSITALWLAPDGSAGATVGNHAFASGAGATWQGATPTIAFTELRGDAVGDLYALGLGDGDTVARVWHYDGTQWSAATDPLASSPTQLVVGTTTVYAILDRQLLTIDRTTGVSAVTALAFGIDELSGLGGELFAQTNDTDVVSPIWYSAGAGWSPVRVPLGLTGKTYTGIADTGTALVVTVSNVGPHLDDLAYRLVRTGPWTP